MWLFQVKESFNVQPLPFVLNSHTRLCCSLTKSETKLCSPGEVGLLGVRPVHNLMCDGLICHRVGAPICSALIPRYLNTQGRGQLPYSMLEFLVKVFSKVCEFSVHFTKHLWWWCSKVSTYGCKLEDKHGPTCFQKDCQINKSLDYLYPSVSTH